MYFDVKLYMGSERGFFFPNFFRMIAFFPGAAGFNLPFVLLFRMLSRIYSLIVLLHLILSTFRDLHRWKKNFAHYNFQYNKTTTLKKYKIRSNDLHHVKLLKKNLVFKTRRRDTLVTTNNSSTERNCLFSFFLTPISKFPLNFVNLFFLFIYFLSVALKKNATNKRNPIRRTMGENGSGNIKPLNSSSEF